MLVLSRKLGEKIMIGEGDGQVVITVVDIDRGKIRLGIEAPRDVPIYRQELLGTKPPAPADAAAKVEAARKAYEDALAEQERILRDGLSRGTGS